jgi:hypothetical protein
VGYQVSQETWRVECSSGWTYAERPAALILNGERLEIEAVEQMWRSPQGRHFWVTLADRRRFHLLYLEGEDCWEVEAK